MTATDFRKAALRLSQAREYVMDRLIEQQLYDFDVNGIARDLAASEDRDVEFTAEEWEAFIGPHQFDESGLTDAALAKALANSQTGWVVMIRRPNGDVQTLNWDSKDDATPESIEADLRSVMRLPAGTSIMVLPLVG